MATPYATVHLASVESTQDEARARADAGPVLVVADRQTRGRGRSGTAWWQADRAVFASLAFPTSWAPERRGPLPLLAGLAARTALGGAVGLKWPNDLVSADAKVGGILTEASGDLVVVGLGVNLWWGQPPSGAGAVHLADPGPGAARRIAATWADTLLRRHAAGPGSWGRAEYAACCVTLGRDVSWEPGGAGRAVDVAADGALLVEIEGRVEAVRAGEVRLVRTADRGSLPAGYPASQEETS